MKTTNLFMFLALIVFVPAMIAFGITATNIATAQQRPQQPTHPDTTYRWITPQQMIRSLQQQQQQLVPQIEGAQAELRLRKDDLSKAENQLIQIAEANARLEGMIGVARTLTADSLYIKIIGANLIQSAQ